jgi:hypothetical protein
MLIIAFVVVIKGQFKFLRLRPEKDNFRIRNIVSSQYRYTSIFNTGTGIGYWYIGKTYAPDTDTDLAGYFYFIF